MQGQLVVAVEVTEQVCARRHTALLQTELLAESQRRAQERQDVLEVFANAPLAVALLRKPDHQPNYWTALLDQYFPGAGRGILLEKVLPALATPAVVAQLDRLYKNGETYQSEPPLLPGATPGAAAEPPAGAAPQPRADRHQLGTDDEQRSPHAHQR